MAHIALIGDSVFDNAAYVARGEDVTAKLRGAAPMGWRVSLAARDGAILADVGSQLGRVPGDATHLVVSAGGNDALRASGILLDRAGSVAEALNKLAGVQERFRGDYRAMLESALALGRPLAISTIYEARFPEADQRRIAATALTVLNDVITREAAARGLPLLDLRVIFSEGSDYANAIEPSAQGGAKLALAILALVAGHDFSTPRAAIYAG